MEEIVLITGSEGFVGHFLAANLVKRGFQVYGTVLHRSLLANPVPKVNYIETDVCIENDVRSLFESIHPTQVYHLAAISSVAFSWKNPQETIRVNSVGTSNLLGALRDISPKAKFLLIGSSEEYGKIDYTLPVSENVALNPTNVYALTKAFQEQLGKIYASAYGLSIFMTRSFNHFGPGQARGFVISDFCSQIAAIERGLQSPEIQVGNLSAERDFLYVEDVVNAYCKIVEKGTPGTVYNVGSGESHSINSLLQNLLSFSRSPISIVVDPSKFRPIETPVIRADITRINQLGFSPSNVLQKALLDTLNSYRVLFK